MVTKKDLGIITIEQYFDKIVLCQNNAKYNLMSELIDKLSTKQKKECIAYLQTSNYIENEGFCLIRLLTEQTM